MMSIFSHLRPFPDVTRYLRAFGTKDFPRDEALGGFDFKLTLDETSGAISILGEWFSFPYAWRTFRGTEDDTLDKFGLKFSIRI